MIRFTIASTSQSPLQNSRISLREFIISFQILYVMQASILLLLHMLCTVQSLSFPLPSLPSSLFLSDQGLPVLPNCCAVLEASMHSVHSIGDHHVWYGQVESISSSTLATPLLYYARQAVCVCLPTCLCVCMYLC